MVELTQNERKTILVLFKDFNSYHNARTISKILNISHVGAQKICKRLLKENILTSKRIGKSIIYKVNNNDDYVKSLVTFLLADEAHHFKRWQEEFRELKGNIVIIYGSAIKDYAHARDIDIIVVIEKDDKEIQKILKKKEEILPKKLHAIILTQKDLRENIKKKDKVIIDIVKNAVILYGQEKYTEILGEP